MANQSLEYQYLNTYLGSVKEKKKKGRRPIRPPQVEEIAPSASLFDSGMRREKREGR